MFGKKTVNISMVLPHRLQQVCSILFNATTITPEILVNNHTFYPLFRPFLPEDRNKKIKQSMNEAKEKSILYKAGITQSKIPFPSYLRLCLKCFKENKHQYGEAYWHRSHQMYGVNICHIHGEPLLESNKHFSSRANNQSLYPLSKIILKEATPVHLKTEFIDHELAISKSVFSLLSRPFPVIGLASLGEKYSYYLRKYGLEKFTGTVNKRQLLKSFQQFYDQTLLEELYSYIHINNTNNWIDNIVRPRTVTHPLRHILFMNFLNVTPLEFFTNAVENEHPFGKGPWLCFNAASNHYKQAVITECEVKWGTQGCIIGTFKCSCGFVYSRKGPDEKEEDRYKIGQIKSFGPLWEKELIRLRTGKKKRTIKETAHMLHVTPLTVIRKLKKINNSHCDEFIANKELDNKYIEYRAKWLQVIKDNKDLNKTGLRELVKKEFIWLYRYDRTWLKENSPLFQKKSNGGKHVCWEKRDKEISKQVTATINELIYTDNTERPIRLTITSIGKKSKEWSKISYGLEKMPITKKIIEEASETVEEFQIRRVKWALNVLQEKGENVTTDKIRKKASLSNLKMTKKVKRVIESEVGKFLLPPLNL